MQASNVSNPWSTDDIACAPRKPQAVSWCGLSGYELIKPENIKAYTCTVKASEPPRPATQHKYTSTSKQHGRAVEV